MLNIHRRSEQNAFSVRVQNSLSQEGIPENAVRLTLIDKRELQLPFLFSGTSSLCERRSMHSGLPPVQGTPFLLFALQVLRDLTYWRTAE